MDLEALRIFIKVAELGSFTRAAEHLGLTKSRASLQVRALEADVGNRLLQRTTRVVRPTPDGEQFLARARRLVLEADELASMFQAPSSLRGRVRIDLPVGFAREVLIPKLPDFLAPHPQLEMLLSVTDRRVEVVREGFDCVLSVGSLSDSGLVARRLGTLAMVNCASPAYLRRQGVPGGLDDLDRHLVVNYSLTLGGDPPTFEYADSAGYQERPMRSLVTVNNSDAYTAACLAGLGIIQMPRFGAARLFESGELVEVLPGLTCAPMPVSLVHSHGRNLPRRVRAVMSWIAQLIEPYLVTSGSR
jgi:DNA-binding transcriptional LysR family regulator